MKRRGREVEMESEGVREGERRWLGGGGEKKVGEVERREVKKERERRRE